MPCKLCLTKENEDCTKTSSDSPSNPTVFPELAVFTLEAENSSRKEETPKSQGTDHWEILETGDKDEKPCATKPNNDHGTTDKKNSNSHNSSHVECISTDDQPPPEGTAHAAQATIDQEIAKECKNLRDHKVLINSNPSTPNQPTQGPVRLSKTQLESRRCRFSLSNEPAKETVSRDQPNHRDCPRFAEKTVKKTVQHRVISRQIRLYKNH